MTARYIDLGPEAVLAVLDGRKTRFTVPLAVDGDVPFRCGDAVRVREDHAAHWGARHPRGRIVAGVDVLQHDGRTHRATADDPLHVHYAADAHGPQGRCDGPARYRPAAEMPDWAVRLVLHVASVRVGRCTT